MSNLGTVIVYIDKIAKVNGLVHQAIVALQISLCNPERVAPEVQMKRVVKILEKASRELCKSKEK